MGFLVVIPVDSSKDCMFRGQLAKLFRDFWEFCSCFNEYADQGVKPYCCDSCTDEWVQKLLEDDIL